MTINMEKTVEKKDSARPDEYLVSSQGQKSNFRRDGSAQTKSITVLKLSNPHMLKSKLWQYKRKKKK